MPSTSLQPPPPRRLFGPQGRLPVWAQWVIPFGIAGILILALVLFVDRAEQTAAEPAAVDKPAAIAEQNREARILVEQDQAPHTLRIARPTAAPVAMRLAVTALVRAELTARVISGTLQHVACHPAPGGSATRAPYRCTAEVADVNYLFEGAVQPAAHRVTVCKRDLPPVPGLNVPVSRRCT